MLVLTRRAGPSAAKPKSGRVEHIELDAAYYSQQAGVWKAEWTLHDFVECPGLDSAADFFSSNVSITDLNGDGKAEITIVKIPGQEPFGGEHQYDKHLLSPANAAYKQHMDQVWKVVSIVVRN